MIVGTAGHIDHGKSTLVAALTGMDADRLPEEKKRGISIELGYAWLEVPGGEGRRIGFVDAPGHERLVHTMLAGASGIDFALLLIAADDGLMPQSREHLAALSMLGLHRGAVLITKCDLVDYSRVADVQAEVAVLIRGTSLDRAPILPVSAHTGEGLDVLREMLFAAATDNVDRGTDARAFRLAADRVFTLDGVGVVVAGTVHAGGVRVGDELALVPSLRSLRARVRGIHVHDRQANEAISGQRCALALGGVSRDNIERGQWLVDPTVALETDRLDVRLTVWRDEAQALRSGIPVHVHLGSARVVGSVAMLEGDALAAGATGRAQLVLRAPFAAWRGDRIVLRDGAASRTIAGGQVLDPYAPARYRRTVQRLAELDACALETPGARLSALLAVASNGLDLERWARGEGLAPASRPSLPAETLHVRGAGFDRALGATHAAATREAVISALTEYHRCEPNEFGPDAGRLRRLSAPRLPAPLWSALITRLAHDGFVKVHGPYVHLPEHGVQLSASEERMVQKTAPLFLHAGFGGVWVRDLSRETGEPELLMRTTLARLARRGDLHQVVKDLYYSAATMTRLALIVRTLTAEEGGSVTAARFRDATGLGRKRAIQILEYFDRVGLLRRVSNVHKLRTDTSLFDVPEEPASSMI